MNLYLGVAFNTIIEPSLVLKMKIKLRISLAIPIICWLMVNSVDILPQ